MQPWLTVVGIGEDGFEGLGQLARECLSQAPRIVGGARHLAMLPAALAARGEAWPRPFSLAPVLQRRGEPVCVLASGDPMHHGVGASLARSVAPAEMRVYPAPSAFSLAAARLGWPLAELATVSLIGRPFASLRRVLHRGARVLVLLPDGAIVPDLADWLQRVGFGPSEMTVLSHLGGPLESARSARADAWEAGPMPALSLLALRCWQDADSLVLPATPGLPDSAYTHDGQLTKRDVRAMTLARLAPCPGELLWDVGAGAGSIGIEWMRAHPDCRAIAVEPDATRLDFLARNAAALGVPGLRRIEGRAPEALHSLPTPDAVFIGGGVSRPGVLEACWAALRPGGRLLANAVTLQSEACLQAWRESHGGKMIRLSVSQAQALGGFEVWRTALPVTLLHALKPW